MPTTRYRERASTAVDLTRDVQGVTSCFYRNRFTRSPLSFLARTHRLISPPNINEALFINEAYLLLADSK
jgi:hypothetical protein